MKVTLFDYGAGNLHSLAKALVKAGGDVEVETDPAACAKAEVLVLPGVGAFGHAASRLAPGRDELRAALADGLPCLGICLGMQLLYERSEEGEGEGLGFFQGTVHKIASRRVPHMGWNFLEDVKDERLSPLSTAYFAHSYVCSDDQSAVAFSHHEEVKFPAAVARNRALGVQFHPEKSSGAGLSMLRAFLEGARR